MNQKIASIIILAALSGCATVDNTPKAETRILERLEYVVKIPPAELMEIPPQVPNIDVDTATQADIARWIIANEERIRVLENIIKDIATFLRNEKSKLDAEAQKVNEANGTFRIPADTIKADQ